MPYHMYIDGQFVEASNGQTRDNYNPAKGEVMAQVPEATAADVDDAADTFEYYGGLANKITGEVNPLAPKALDFTIKEPVGVCGQIIPWNFPLMMAAWKIAPALAAGCTLVLKPAEQTPLTALKLAEMLNEINELPKSAVNIVTGDGPAAGATLVKSHGVDKIAFTGNTEQVYINLQQKQINWY